VAFEEGAGVLEVLFGVGFGGGDAVKGFVEDATMRFCSDDFGCDTSNFLS